jgi:hypothetical protein
MTHLHAVALPARRTAPQSPGALPAGRTKLVAIMQLATLIDVLPCP